MAYLHLDVLLVAVFTKVVHQLHGPGLTTSGLWTFAGLLKGPTH